MDKITKGNKAKALLEDEVLQSAFAEMETRIIQAIYELPDNDIENLQLFKISLSLLTGLQRNLEVFVEEGELQEFELDQEKRPTFLGELEAWKPTTKQ